MKVQVKICGLTNLDDAARAAQAGADLLGFIFTPKSARFVPIEEAAEIAAGVRQSCGARRATPPKFVGVFVDEDPNIISGAFDRVGLDYVQLHGSEPPEMLRRFTGRSYKAIRPRPGEDADSVTAALTYAALGVDGGPRLLVDAYSPDAYGGTGQLTDWSYAARLGKQVSGLVLAGGLNPDNVLAAIDAVHPWGVDVSSGVEVSPGRKDHDAICRLITAVHGDGM